MEENISSIKTRIREYILEAINIPDLGDDEDLFVSGIVNSLFAVQLISFLENSFKIEVNSEDLEIENFKSIDAAAAFVVGKHPR